MANSGDSGTITVTLTLDRKTGKLRMQAPKDLGATYQLLRAGLDLVMDKAMKTGQGPERKVKTLDEMGLSATRRLD